ncbi:hypothetical protein CIL05_08185 [Virgibacillus profundi]|uniref:Cation efflux protein cytoplasmic domain-containing protein n=1 Tax=Virgibacillus profundi TaxID=2024555 RepID=A0A2A2IDP7_9BACI|nr:hypothetical protein CIL05_08185 [Virgibacillus profundi]PXY54021.1 cation transporter [Virgibacillus profundi]
MEGKLGNINVNRIKETLIKLEGVENVHDLHVWSIISEFPTLSCHIVVNDSVNRDHLLQKVNTEIKGSFNISHCTIQLEDFNSAIHKDCDFCK